MPTGQTFFTSEDILEIARAGHPGTSLPPEIAGKIAGSLDHSAAKLLDWIAAQSSPNSLQIRTAMGNAQRRGITLWETIGGGYWDRMEGFVPFTASMFDKEKPGSESAPFRLVRAMGAGDPTTGLERLNALGRLLADVYRAADVVIDSLLPPDARGDRRYTGSAPNRVSGEPFAYAVLEAFHGTASLPIIEARFPKAGTAPRPSPRPGVAMVTAAYEILRRCVAANLDLGRLAGAAALDPGKAVVEKWVRSFRSRPPG